MKVIFNNDDMGLLVGFTEGIKKCYLRGATTSASVRTNGLAYQKVAKLPRDRFKNLGLGLHLNLTDGKTDTPELSNANGDYKYNFFLLFMYIHVFGGKRLIPYIEKDFEKQFIRMEVNGMRIDHIDGEKHVQMIPEIFELTCKLCKKYKIKYLRLTNEPFYFTKSLGKNLKIFLNGNIIKYLLLKYLAQKDRKILEKYKIKTCDGFYGILYTNIMDFEVIASAIKNAQRKGYGLIEILSHPAYRKMDREYTSTAFKKYSNQKNREIERRALLSNKLLNFLDQGGLKRVSFKEV